MQAESNRAHDKDGCEDKEGTHSDNERVVGVQDKIAALSDTHLGKSSLSNCLYETSRIGTFFSWAPNLDHKYLLVVGSIFEDIGALIIKCECENRWDLVIDGILSEHFLLEVGECAEVENVICVHHTVLHVDRIVAWTINVEKE